MTEQKHAHKKHAFVVSKLDLALIVAVIAAGALWVEHEHRLVIDAPSQAELDAAQGAAACPGNDSVPYSAKCLEFLKGATTTGMSWRINATDSAAAAEPAPLR